VEFPLDSAREEKKRPSFSIKKNGSDMKNKKKATNVVIHSQYQDRV